MRFMLKPLSLYVVQSLVFAAVVSLPSSASALSVTLNGGGYNSFAASKARTTYPTEVLESLVPGSIPYFDSSTVADGDASAGTVVSLTDTGFIITFDHIRTTASNSVGQTGGAIYFSVDEDVFYEAAGAYTAVDSEGRLISLDNYLNDFTTQGPTIFATHVQSNSTPNESFVLGVAGGDFSNNVYGPLTGTLVAGHVYEWGFNAVICTFCRAVSNPSATGATASGFVSLSFVPEPSTALLMGLGLAGLAIRRD
jgi:hypothetical protein